MKRLITFLSCMAWVALAFAQINFVDAGANFDLYNTGTYRSTHGKGQAYIDIDASNRISVKRTANGSQITQFSTWQNYRVNGDTFPNQAALLLALNEVLFKSPCGSVAGGCETTTFSYCLNLTDSLYIFTCESVCTPVISLTIGNETNPATYTNLVIGAGDTITKAEIITLLFDSLTYNDPSGKTTFTVTTDGFCIESTEKIEDQIFVFFGNNQTGVDLPAICSGGVETTGNVITVSQTCSESVYIQRIKFTCE